MAGKKRSHSPEEDDDEDVNENMENGSEEMEVDVDEDDDRRSSSRSKKHKKKKKVGLMQQSGQTEADRRILRKKQRELHQEMVMGNGGTSSSAAAAAAGGGGGGKARDGNDELFAQWREQNNELYNEVRYTREAVLDSENIDLIANKAAREAEKIVQVSFNVCLYMFVIFFHVTHHIHSHSPLSLVVKYNMIFIILILGTPLRCRAFGSSFCQKGVRWQGSFYPIGLARSWLSGGRVFQFHPHQCFIFIRPARCRIYAQGT